MNISKKEAQALTRLLVNNFRLSEVYAPEVLEEVQLVVFQPEFHKEPPETRYTFQTPGHDHHGTHQRWKPTIYLCPNTLTPCCGQALDQKTLETLRSGWLLGEQRWQESLNPLQQATLDQS